MENLNPDVLMDYARGARKKAYAPYSGFRVGAALLTAAGNIYTGCNVENVSYSATICAERSAICAAVTAGEREFTALAVSAGQDVILPCGICRQTLAEFSRDGKLTVLCDSRSGIETYTLGELLPRAFSEFKPDADA